jgi:hypothetical protein
VAFGATPTGPRGPGGNFCAEGGPEDFCGGFAGLDGGVATVLAGIRVCFPGDRVSFCGGCAGLKR